MPKRTPVDVWDDEADVEEEFRSIISSDIKIFQGSILLVIGFLISGVKHRHKVVSQVKTGITADSISGFLVAAGASLLILSLLKNSSSKPKRRKKASSSIEFVYEVLNDHASTHIEKFFKKNPEFPDWFSSRLDAVFDKAVTMEVKNQVKEETEYRNEMFKEIKTIVDEWEKNDDRSMVSVNTLRAKLVPRVFFIEFNDLDPPASPEDLQNLDSLQVVSGVNSKSIAALSEVVTLLLEVATESDEVCVHVESPGGSIIDYGLCFSQLKRLKEKNIKVTVLVDKVMASGGYFVACAADKVVASPFAIVGSIGVVTEMFNFNKFLKNWDVDYDVYTAGKYKRTVHPLIPKTEEGEAKLKEELEIAHEQFKSVVEQGRDMSKQHVDSIATGETWFAQESVEKNLGLVDEIKTSAAYLNERMTTHEVVRIRRTLKKRSLTTILMREMLSMTKAIKSKFTSIEESVKSWSTGLPMAKL